MKLGLNILNFAKVGVSVRYYFRIMNVDLYCCAVRVAAGCCVVICAIIWPSVVHAEKPWSDAFSDAQPVFRIEHRHFRLLDVTGVKGEELQKLLNSSIADMSTQEMRDWLSLWQYGRYTGTPIHEIEGREQLADAVGRLAVSILVEDALRQQLLTYVAKSVLARHGQRLEDYYDIAMIRHCMDQQSELLKLLWSQKNTEQNSFNYKNAKDFGYAGTSEQWQDSVRYVNKRPSFRLWNAFILANTDVHAYIAHDLFAEACTQGIFADKALKALERQKSEYFQIDLHGFGSAEDKVSQLLSLLVDEDGVLARGGLRVVRDVFRSEIVPGSITTRRIQGRQWGLNELGALPDVGVVVRRGEEHLRWYAFGMLGNINRNDEGMKIIRDAVAFTIAAGEFAPEEVEIFVDVAYTSGVPVLLQALSVPGHSLFAPENEEPRYILKQYPAEAFQNVESLSPDLQLLALEFCLAVVENSLDDQKHAIDRAKSRMSNAKSQHSQAVWAQFIQHLEQVRQTHKFESIEKEADSVK